VINGRARAYISDKATVSHEARIPDIKQRDGQRRPTRHIPDDALATAERKLNTRGAPGIRSVYSTTPTF
jgi:hypothetical protein